MEEDRQLQIRKDKIYSEWRRFLDFWWSHPSLDLQECFTIFMMQKKNEVKEENNE